VAALVVGCTTWFSTADALPRFVVLPEYNAVNG
jgi:hypothetical protein